MKRILPWVLALVIGLGTGCRTKTQIYPSSEDESNLRATFSYAPKWSNVKLKEPKRISPHPDDSRFLHGETEVKAENGFDLYGFGAGLEYDHHVSGTHLYAGLEAEIDLSELENNSSIDDITTRSVKQQISDKRPKSEGSFVYDKVNPSLFSFSPYLGFGVDSDGNEFYTKFGLVYKEFEREWGHHRWGEEDKIGSESERVLGKKLSIGFYSKGESIINGIEFSGENYTLDMGNINSYSIQLIKDF